MGLFDDCTKTMAAKFAQALPERMEAVLFVVYCLASTELRRTIESEDEYVQYLLSFLKQIKVEMEAAERKANKEVPDDLDLQLFMLLKGTRRHL